MQIVAVPFFNQDMSVEAYTFRYLKENNLFSKFQNINVFDGASSSDAIKTLNYVGLDAYTLGKPLFVPIDELMLLGNLDLQCKQPPDKIVFLFEGPVKQDGVYLEKMKHLRQLGYRFAMNFAFSPDEYSGILPMISFVFLSQRPENKARSQALLAELRRKYPEIVAVALHIYSQEELESLYGHGYSLYESRFYKITNKGGTVSPLKANSIRLLNTVRDENFEFDQVSEIVQSDPALTISLLKIVNAPHYGARKRIASIQQAVSMMGQLEVRKWVTTAMTRSLGDDRSDELSRISLVRGKFAENLAVFFDQARLSSELFLMGLFSVLDSMLGVSMETALETVFVPDSIRQALMEGKGVFAPVMQLVTDYCNANWGAVSRQMIVHSLPEDELSNAYIEALVWYRNVALQDQASDEIPGAAAT